MFQRKLVILLTILLLTFSLLGQQQDGSVFERRITLNQQNQTLDLILEQISWQANVFFSYDAAILDAERKLSIYAEDKSLFTVLQEIFGNNLYSFSELENQIIITEKEVESAPIVIKADTVPIKYFFLSGKLLENRKGRPVPYASISVLNKPIGTISNNDGEFLLKLHPDNIGDTVVISSMGYAQILLPAHQLLDEDLFILNPVSIRIKEVKVTAITPENLLQNMRENREKNYSNHPKLMTAFYRETVKQDDGYINVSEAVMEILKAPYSGTRSDLVRLLKGRKSPDVQPIKWLNFKLQGGPFTITQLDAVKITESFISEEFQSLYSYSINNVIWYNNQPVYVVKFHPLSSTFFPAFEGEMYVHRETFALIHAKYQISKAGLRKAQEVLIKKKPRKVKARPSYVHYQVSYQNYQGKWHLSTAQASVKFKVRSKRDKLNSEFHSVSDLLITNIHSTDVKRFTKNEKFTQNDIFVEMLGDYDEEFWENYNIIRPDENLRNAFKIVSLKGSH